MSSAVPPRWRVTTVGESTPERPSGNSYIAYRRMEAKDFTLKFEIKVEGTGGSGFQYRSRTGLPWLANIPANLTAFNGPVNLNWMMTGPQADFWPSTVIARSGTFLHIVNGQLLAVMIDDDAASSNNWSGQFGIEIEAAGRSDAVVFLPRAQSLWLAHPPDSRRSGERLGARLSSSRSKPPLQPSRWTAFVEH
ncbi:MAG: DUF1080 domain-containing protein [Acidobacteriota bacterium]|nr:DUF1080 domain-containing protein [Actinomycetota bacterium]MDP9324877.1 DUF1080 domain-containing protein [Acidobacteriota bacterium]